MGKQILSKDIVNKRIHERSIELVGEYINKDKKTTFRGLACGHEWEARPNDVMVKKSGCPHCSKNAKLSKDIVNERIHGREIEMIGEYVNKSTKSLFRHLICGNNWEATPGNIMKGNGCPLCVTHGFDASKPAYIYVMKCSEYLKYGITNNLKRRLASHRFYDDFKIVYSKLYDDSSIAIQLENTIKETLGGRYVTKDRLPNGFTETLPAHLLPNLLAITEINT
jgi:hypothetical protein